MKSDKRKQSLYFPEDMLEEIKREANRQDRSLSWIVQRAWTIARNEIQRFPSVNDPSPDDEEDREELG
ncbi:MAG: TIGR04563 family protein [Bradymonadales bacterium]|nr:TIGR04563 family protein [Bradymonadales bacterium]